MFVALTVQMFATVAVTVKVVDTVFAANAEVEARPSARNPKAAADSADFTTFEYFIMMAPVKFVSECL
jgi:hypothetical protein